MENAGERTIDAETLKAGYLYFDGRRTTRHSFTVIRQEGDKFVVADPVIPPTDPIIKEWRRR